MLKNLIEKNNLPHKSGIYIYKNAMGKVIYVGKAVDLFSRVNSYFSTSPHNLKTTQLIQNIDSIETIVVESELEALILEANLIKKFLPLYNIRLTDDKDYLYIAITKEDFPRVITVRKKDLKTIKEWFGPFPSSKTVKETLKKLRRIFPWCSSPKGSKTNKSGRPCFYYHIGQCPGACVGEISRGDYNKIINRFSKFLDGKKEELLEELTVEMVKLSEEMEYEEASQVKKVIGGINYITQSTSITKYLENPNFLEDINKQALVELQKDLGLDVLPERIEGYDISNFSGKEATGSMVVLTNGEIDKSQYRKFNIKMTGRPNDVGMHKEMMRRRLKHKEWPLPQLVLVDGGRGQVRGSVEEISNFKLQISNNQKESNNLTMKQLNNLKVYGLAKRMEWLYPPEGEVVKLPKRSLSLRLLQKIRDESHRFAVTYHRKLRKKSFGY